ncbi:UDP-N-acetylmuramate--L-alanine ligase [Candidatus Peregrinibacteria bacterium]|nr:UDP-N-acetylmuramate--L-alanine ligase [Candidatus Peregrinibacteria bacterium]
MRVHFIGIGGIGLSAIAQIMRSRGHKVSGSDNCPSELTEELKKQGIEVYDKHSEENIKDDIELIVYSPAVPDDNVELKKGRETGIKTISYSDALGQLSEEMYTVAIAGTHGKSTTTAMTALILDEGGLDPTLVIGTKMPEYENNNYRVGDSNYLVLEACEYKRTFLTLNPDILIITNIEADHLDYYKDLDDYCNAFKELIAKMPEDGTVIINSSDKNAENIVKEANCQVVRWGDKTKDNYKFINSSLIFNEAKELSEYSLKIKPGVPGKFNKENAVFAAIAGVILEVDDEKIEKAVSKFKGTWRRLEVKETQFKDKIFIDDYGHHPTEIALTLKAIKDEYPNKKMLLIYQPHQYSRTHHLLKEFGESFKNADEVIIPDIYEVRDSQEDKDSVSTDDLVKEIQKNGVLASNGNGLENTADIIKTRLSEFDLIVTMGAGNIDRFYYYL